MNTAQFACWPPDTAISLPSGRDAATIASASFVMEGGAAACLGSAARGSWLALMSEKMMNAKTLDVWYRISSWTSLEVRAASSSYKSHRCPPDH